jgi:DNA polymerase III epsilon subunit-like protein
MNKKKLVFFDTETSGMVDFRQGPEYAGQPRVIQIAAVQTDETGTVLNQLYCLVGFDATFQHIQEGATKVHGVSDAMLNTFGLSRPEAIKLWLGMMESSDIWVAHNASFDKLMLNIETHRLGKLPTQGKETYCTMMKSTSLCKLPKKGGGWKWPKLGELYAYLFGKEMANAHDALGDITATKECYFELIKRGVV